MTTTDHTRILAIGFAAFGAIFLLTFILLVLVTVGVFGALGITMAKETGDMTHAGIGLLGAVFTIVFYGALALVFVLPPAVAAWKLFKKRKRARVWGVIASVVVLVLFPLGTVLGGYGLWFFFVGEGKNLAVQS